MTTQRVHNAENEGAAAGAPTIWALSAGRAGDARQARALAQAVARRVGGAVVEHTAAPRPPYDRLPAWLWALGGAREGGWPFSALRDAGAGLAPPWPSLVVGCGRRVAPVVAALGRVGGCRTAQIMDPQMRLSAFDAVVAPAHDGLAAPNLTPTLGALNDLDAATLAEAGAAWARRLGHLPRPRVAVLVGGPSRAAPFGARDAERLEAGLTRLAVEGCGLMVTPSRRTPPALVERLAGVLGGLGGWLWPGVGDNPYPGVLALADAVVVTADSVNMACEAAVTGRPVFVSAVDGLPRKRQAFQAALAGAGVARPLEAALDEDGRLARWSYPPLAEAERVAEGLAQLAAPA